MRVLVRRTSSPRRLEGVSGVESAEGDVTDPGSVARALGGIDRVYHCAAIYEIGARDPAAMRAVNVGGTENVLRASAERNVPVVYVSSTVALGPTAPGSVADESHWAGDAPRSPYEATKREAHVLARKMATSGASVRIASPCTIYGPDDPSLTGATHRWIARGVMRVGALAEVPMTLVHVDDCAEALVLVAERGRDQGEYIVAERVITFREWFTLAAQAAERKPPSLWLPDGMLRGVSHASFMMPRLLREGLAMSVGACWAFRSDKARNELGWMPRPLEVGLRETMDFYRKR